VERRERHGELEGEGQQRNQIIAIEDECKLSKSGGL